ncbi:MAG: trigger factor [Puniceicoccales bacterium]|nr:trigger factor [Puniceicoccales bacterium]
MTHTIEDIGPLRKTATLTIPAATLAEHEKEVLKDFAAQVRLPGFRPGHAPRDLVKRQFGQAIGSEVAQKALTSGMKYLREQFSQGIQAIVNVEGLESISATADATLTITLDLAPEITLPEYKGLDVPEEAVFVADEEVGKAVEDFRSTQSRFEVVDRAAENGDYVKLSYIGTVDGKPVKEIAPKASLYGTHTSTWEEAGPANNAGIPEIANGLVGKKAGDKATFLHAFPAGDECPFEELRGKTASYEVEVFEVRARILPELNEEFFKNANATDLDDLKKQLRDRILKRKESEAATLRRKKAVETLVAQVPDFPIPESSVARVAKTLLIDSARASITTEAEAKELAEAFDQEAKKFYPEAEKRLKEVFILLEIAKKEDVKVTREEFSMALTYAAYQTGEHDVRKFASAVMKDPELHSLYLDQVRQTKAVNLIFENLKK